MAGVQQARVLLLGEQIMPNDNATVKSVQVRFSLPKGDNKDDNTTLTCRVKKDDTLIASKIDFANGQEFNDPGEYGPFDLDINTAVTKAEYRGSRTYLAIQPHGGREHDTVIMNTILEVRFTDNTTLTSESGVHRYENASSYEWSNP
jgi:hypothetical protein